MKDYSVKNGDSYILVSYNDSEFHLEQDDETGDMEEVYDEYFKLDHVFVAKEARGKGLAKQMIREVVESIRADFPEIRITLAALPEGDKPIDQEGLVSLYRSCGFEVRADALGSAAVVMDYAK